jgi:RND family efflux transporter MFP subunit
MSFKIMRLRFTLIAFVALLALTACGKQSQQGPAAGGPGGGMHAMPVKVEVAKLQRVGDFTEYLATIQSRNASVLQPQVEGQITRIFVHSGQHVNAGQPLIQIDPLKQQATVKNQEATLRAKQATVDWNRTQLDRSKKLYTAGVASKQELDQAQTAYDSSVADLQASEAGVHEQQVQLRYYSVDAPTAGIVGDIPVRVGDRVSTQTMLTTLDTGGDLEAYISVPADKSGEVRPGAAVDIVDDSGAGPLKSRVTFVSPRVDTASQTVLVKAAVPNQGGRFRNDEVVRARVYFGEHDAPLIPITAVTRLGGRVFSFVAVNDGGKTIAKQQPIEVGEVVGNQYVVKSGIQAGDRIITSSLQMLADGMPVNPQS